MYSFIGQSEKVCTFVVVHFLPFTILVDDVDELKLAPPPREELELIELKIYGHGREKAISKIP